MPYDDSDVKKMIKYQTERKVGFSRSKNICSEVKDLIHSILEAHVDRRYTVQQITQHPWLVHAAIVAPPAAARTTAQTPAPTVAAPNGGAAARVTIVTGETGVAGGRMGATATPAAVGNDTMSQNNNSNVEAVWSRLLNNFIHSVHSIFSSSTTNSRTTSGTTTSGELQLATRYAFESAVDRERLRRKAKVIWNKRRSALHMALRRPWR